MKKKRSPKKSTENERKSDASDGLNGTATVDVADLWGDPHDPEKRAIEPAVADAKANLNWLAKRAHQGDKIAFARLVAVSSHGATLVRALTKAAYPIAKEIAMGTLCWPVNITDSGDFPDDLNVLRARLSIGSNQPLGFNLRVRLNYKSKTRCREVVVHCILVLTMARAFERKKRDTEQFVLLTRALDEQARQPDLPDHEKSQIEKNAYASRRLANALYRQIDPLGRTVGNHLKSLRKLIEPGEPWNSMSTRVFQSLEVAKTLPDLSADTQSIWYEAIKALILAITNNHPEQTALKEIGEYRADAYFRRERTAQGALDAKARAKKTGSAANTTATNIRDGIFTKVKQQLKSLVKEPSSKKM